MDPFIQVFEFGAFRPLHNVREAKFLLMVFGKYQNTGFAGLPPTLSQFVLQSGNSTDPSLTRSPQGSSFPALMG